MENYSRGEIYKCYKETSEQLNIDKLIILKTLEEKYTGISKIIKNYEKCMLHPSRRLNGLSGPNYLVFFPNIANRRILLLGEKHAGNILCPSEKLRDDILEVHIWLKQLIKNAPSCVDIFNEVKYKVSHEESNRERDCGYEDLFLEYYTSPLAAVHCEMISPKFSTTQNLRYHTSDLRTYGDWNPMALITKNVQETKSIKTEKYKDIQNKYYNRIDDIIKYLLGLTLESKVYYDYLEESYKFLNMNYDRMAIERYYAWYFNHINKELSKMRRSINKQKFLTDLLKTYTEIEKFPMVSTLLLIPMDLYILTRMFMKFEPIKLKRGPIRCQKEEMENIIILSGFSHTKIYKAFLEYHFSISANLVIQGQPTQCLKLDNYDFFQGS